MGEEHEVFIESSVRGYHAYFVNASVAIGEVLTCERDHDNVHDKYAIAVKNERPDIGWPCSYRAFQDIQPLFTGLWGD